MNVGIVGFGDGGRCNFESLSAIGEEVIAICDRDEKALLDVDGVRTYSDIQSMLASEDVELIVIATPDGEHLAPTKAALEAGKRVFVEKPVATTIADLQEFEKLAGRYHERILFSEKYSFADPVQVAFRHRSKLGAFLWGSTFYLMANCNRIMGGGKWRTECAYNPCAGGLSHNFMTALLFVRSPITRVRATGQVCTYHENLDRFGGFDTMQGTLEFATGQQLNWTVCLAVRGNDSPFGHRTVTHTFQFEHGSICYGPRPENDRLIIDGRVAKMGPEPDAEQWREYNLGLYKLMHDDLLSSISLRQHALHTTDQGINVAYACSLAFESAKQDGRWLKVPN